MLRVLCCFAVLMSCFDRAFAESIRVVTLGDSITKGVRSGVAEDQTFAAELQRQLRAGNYPDAEVINVGIGGEMAGQGLKRLEREVVAKKPHLVTIMYGHNDSYIDVGKTTVRVTVPRFRADMSQLVERLREAGITPILMTPPAYAEKSGPNGAGEHCNIKLSRYAEVVRQVAETLQVPLVDHYSAWEAVSKAGTDLNEWTTDGYHPNSKGHVDLAGRILPTIVNNVGSRSEYGLVPWPELKVEGAVAYRRDGNLIFRQIAEGVTELRLPRLNNVVRFVTARSQGQWQSASLRQGPDLWTIPISNPVPSEIKLLTNGMPRFCEAPAVSRPGPDGVLTLSAHDAEIHGGDKLQFEPLTHKNTVGYWVNPSEYAEWSYELDQPGEFEVEILQGCGGHAGSNVELGFPEGAVPFIVEETGHFQNFVWRKIGKIALQEPGVQVMSLKCKKLAKGAVMDMRQVRLVPVDLPERSIRTMRDVAPDLVVPLAHLPGDAAPGKKLFLPIKGVYANHLYLPTNWNANQKWPVLIELPGNGGYRNEHGDECSGTDGCLAFGLSGGYGAICVNVPFLTNDGNSLQTTWWGDAPTYDMQPTLTNLKNAISEVCEKYHGDPNRVILVGFSRGSIAVNALGLSSDETAGLWKAAVCFSHYDGVREWPFAGSDAASALTRLQRLGNKSQFIISESPDQLAQTRAYLDKTGVKGNWTFATTGFINHDDRWALRPSPARDQIRAWLKQQCQ